MRCCVDGHLVVPFDRHSEGELESRALGRVEVGSASAADAVVEEAAEEASIVCVVTTVCVCVLCVRACVRVAPGWLQEK